MKIFVAGATGVLGRRAVAQLVAAGHEVTGVARSDEKAALLDGLGATASRIDVFDAAAVANAVTGHTTVMNLATHIPPPSRAVMPGAWKQNDRLRTEASRNLVDGSIAAGAERYVQESISFFYPEMGAEWIDEGVPLDMPAYAASVLEAEANAARFAESGTGVVLRFGMFYAHDTTHTKAQIRTAKAGISAFLGPDDAYQSMIHLDDAASAVVAALRAPSGAWNVVDDEPLTRAEATVVLAAALGKRRLRKAPSLLVKSGGATFAALTRSQRVSNERFKAATGWAPRYRSAREGLPAVVQSM